MSATQLLQIVNASFSHQGNCIKLFIQQDHLDEEDKKVADWYMDSFRIKNRLERRKMIISIVNELCERLLNVLRHAHDELYDFVIECEGVVNPCFSFCYVLTLNTVEEDIHHLEDMDSTSSS
mmetsp:Transcript_3399/g.3903  ORF Transcript_3399/g.3903 Transcript_3399/m.3903 type:complete len:122 (+) Transcript_3399:156-521(+)